MEVVKTHPKVLQDPAPLVKVHKLAESSVDFIARPWARREDYWDVRWDLTRAIKLRFEEEGVELARPRRYVVVETYDRWYEAYDMFDVVHPQTILAYGLNGSDLPLGNGAPVRLRVERYCGYKNLKFLKSINVVSSIADIRGGTGGINSDNDWHWYAGA